MAEAHRLNADGINLETTELVETVRSNATGMSDGMSGIDAERQERGSSWQFDETQSESAVVYRNTDEERADEKARKVARRGSASRIYQE